VEERGGREKWKREVEEDGGYIRVRMEVENKSGECKREGED
jgi:hypothetical protein